MFIIKKLKIALNIPNVMLFFPSFMNKYVPSLIWDQLLCVLLSLIH